MPVDRRLVNVAVKRGVTLGVALILIVFFTAVIIGATGYDAKILNALIEQRIQALKQALQRKPGITQEELQQIIENERERLIHIYGLDKPWYSRLVPMTIRTFKLDLNVTSDEVANIAGLRKPLGVGTAIKAALPRTIIMITVAELLAMAIALPLGPYIAYKRGSLLDKSVISYAAITNAAPLWWLAMIAIYLFGFKAGVAPTQYRQILSFLKWDQFVSDPLYTVKQILYFAYLPILVTTFSFLGGWLYSVRAVAIRVVTEDYVVVAKAKGLPENMVVRKYILRVIAGPVVTFVILGLATSIQGFIITETVFDWPGMGSLYYQAILSGDAPTILGLIYVTTVVYILGRYILELLYVILDPRVKM
ncbi:MAG: ABC transporter permease [Desulfurococcales archaeon]|nr:ABC transporter permease [Desulfurococcales archaeon]